MKVLGIQHCVKIVQVRSNAGKYGPEITPYLDIFHAVQLVIELTVCCFQSNKFIGVRFSDIFCTVAFYLIKYSRKRDFNG